MVSRTAKENVACNLISWLCLDTTFHAPLSVRQHAADQPAASVLYESMTEQLICTRLLSWLVWNWFLLLLFLLLFVCLLLFLFFVKYTQMWRQAPAIDTEISYLFFNISYWSGKAREKFVLQSPCCGTEARPQVLVSQFASQCSVFSLNTFCTQLATSGCVVPHLHSLCLSGAGN